VNEATVRRGLCAVLLAGLVLAGLFVAGGAWRVTAQPQTGQTAPDLTGGPWINSDPLTLAGLRGRVVLVEFWTYG
jgi:hypothetical protein